MRDLSLHLMDILQNSVAAKAGKITIGISTDTGNDELKITVKDNGIGMDRELLERVKDPFATSRTTRKVGLGIPLMQASAQRAAGELSIESVKGCGTTLTATFKISHIDRLPLGDVGETITGAILSDPGIVFELTLTHDCKETFNFSTEEVKSKLGEVPVTDFEVITWIKEYIDDGIKLTFGGVLNEIIS